MGKPQFASVDGAEIVIMSRADYEDLMRRVGPTEADEDEGTARLVAEGRDRLARGEEVLIPHDVVVRLDTENPILVLREWRGLTQRALAEAAGIGQGYLSDLENGRRRGTADVLGAVAKALRVPLDFIV